MRWAQRIRSYTSSSTPPAAVAYEDDLLVAVTSHGYDTVFREGEPDEVRLTQAGSVAGAMARFAPDGSLRWARASRPVHQMWTAQCAGWALDGDAVGLPGASVVRFDGAGNVLGTRAVAGVSSSSTWTLLAPGQFLVATPDFAQQKFELARIDW